MLRELRLCLFIVRSKNKMNSASLKLTWFQLVCGCVSADAAINTNYSHCHENNLKDTLSEPLWNYVIFWWSLFFSGGCFWNTSLVFCLISEENVMRNWVCCWQGVLFLFISVKKRWLMLHSHPFEIICRVSLHCCWTDLNYEERWWET